jgi:hypothetical protein
MDRDHVADAAVDDMIGGARDTVEHCGKKLNIAAPRVGQSDTAVQAVKKPDAEMRLEALQLMTDRRRSDMQFLRRARDAQVPCRGLEGLQRSQ